MELVSHLSEVSTVSFLLESEEFMYIMLPVWMQM